MELQRNSRVCREVDESAKKGSQGWFTLLQGRREMLLGHTGPYLGSAGPSSANGYSAKPTSHTPQNIFQAVLGNGFACSESR